MARGVVQLCTLGLLAAGAAGAQEPGAKAGALLAVADFVVWGEGGPQPGTLLRDAARQEAERLGCRAGALPEPCQGDEACLLRAAAAAGASRVLAGTLVLDGRGGTAAVRLVDVVTGATLARAGDALGAATPEARERAVRRLVRAALGKGRPEGAGTLRVAVRGPGARLEVDGTPASPGDELHLAPGAHRIVATRDGFEPQTLDVSVRAEEELELSVDLAPLPPEPRGYVELFGGATIAPRLGEYGVADCAGGCAGGVGGVRAGVRAWRRLGLEAFWVPLAIARRASERLERADAGGPLLVASDYASEARVQAGWGGASASWRFFDEHPVTLRLLAGAARGAVQGRGRGVFRGPGAGPPGVVATTREGATDFWSPVAGPELRAGVRLGRGVVLDAGISAILLLLPSTSTSPGAALEDPELRLPAAPRFGGGPAWVFPATVGLRAEL